MKGMVGVHTSAALTHISPSLCKTLPSACELVLLRKCPHILYNNGAAVAEAGKSTSMSTPPGDCQNCLHQVQLHSGNLQCENAMAISS